MLLRSKMAGSISGTVDGGSGTLDSIRVFQSEGVYTVFNPTSGIDNSGTLNLNGKTIQYAGIDHQDFLSDDGGFQSRDPGDRIRR